MYVHQCLAYEDINGELRVMGEAVCLTLKTEVITTSATLSYTQLKTLSDGILALLYQISLTDALGGVNSGAMTLCFDTPAIQEDKGVMTLCQQQASSARVEDACLSKSA